MELNVKINNRQILVLLLACRFFTLLVSFSNGEFGVQGSGALIVPLLTVGITLISALPLYFLLRSAPGQDIPTRAASIAPSLKKPLTAWCMLLCFLTAIGTASQSEYFITTALYPRAQRWSTILLFMAVVWYMVTVGMEALGRVAVIVCTLVAVSFGLICIGVSHQIDLLNLGHPLYDGWWKIFYTAIVFWGQNLELLLFVLLQPFCREHHLKRDFLSFLFGALLVSEVIFFFTVTVLGEYGKTRVFPVYTLSSISGSGFFSRLDYLHIINWVFLCLLRCALYAYFGGKLLRDLKPSMQRSTGTAISVSIILLITLIFSRSNGAFQIFYTIFASGIPMLLTIVVLPTLLLITEQYKKRKKERTPHDAIQ